MVSVGWWRNLKKHLKESWAAATKWLVFKSRSAVGVWARATWVYTNNKQPVEFYWLKTLIAVLWQFLLLTFCFFLLMVCIRHASLFQRARGEIYLMKKYPFRIGAVTGVVRLDATMCVRVCGCMCVSKCMSVHVAAVTWEREVILICLFWKQ